MGAAEVLLALAKYAPEIAALINVLEGGKITREQATAAILKLQTEAEDAEIDRLYPVKP